MPEGRSRVHAVYTVLTVHAAIRVGNSFEPQIGLPDEIMPRKADEILPTTASSVSARSRSRFDFLVPEGRLRIHAVHTAHAIRAGNSFGTHIVTPNEIRPREMRS